MIKQRYGYARGLAHVSCSASVLCVAVEDGGSLFTSTDPLGGNLAWPLTNIDGNGGDRYLTDVSCAFGTSLCAASDSAGNVVASSNPIGGAGAWTLATVDPGASLAGISCASGAFCVAVDNVGRVVVGQGSPPLAPVNISPPTIDGRAVLGQTLSEAPGGWANSPAMFVYQWEVCDRSGNNCSTIARANGQTYRVAASDVGHAVRVVETTLNAGGTGSAASVDQVAVRPRPAMISASLRSQLVPHGPLARIAVLLRRRGITVPFSTLIAGQLLIRWYYVPKGAHLASGKRTPVVLAIGKAHFPDAGMKNLQIKLTASGVQLLGRAKRLGVTATARLETTGVRTVTARGTFTLKP